MARKFITMVGKTFNRYLVIAKAPSRKGEAYYLCKCNCGNVKEVIGKMLRNGQIKSCGCLRREIVSKTGCDHPRWKSGHSNKSQQIRDSKKYKEWRLDVYKEDHFTCQKCKQVGGDLQAHHILAFSRFEEARFLIENGATLCKECHKEFHNLYGRLKFTDKDFWEYLDE